MTRTTLDLPVEDDLYWTRVEESLGIKFNYELGTTEAGVFTNFQIFNCC